MMGGAGLGSLIWLVVLVDLVLVGIWLWKQIKSRNFFGPRPTNGTNHSDLCRLGFGAKIRKLWSKNILTSWTKKIGQQER